MREQHEEQLAWLRTQLARKEDEHMRMMQESVYKAQKEKEQATKAKAKAIDLAKQNQRLRARLFGWRLRLSRLRSRSLWFLKQNLIECNRKPNVEFGEVTAGDECDEICEAKPNKQSTDLQCDQPNLPIERTESPLAMIDALIGRYRLLP